MKVKLHYLKQSSTFLVPWRVFSILPGFLLPLELYFKAVRILRAMYQEKNWARLTAIVCPMLGNGTGGNSWPFFFFWNSFCISSSLCVYMTHLRGSHLHNIFFNSTCLIAYTIFGLLRMNYSFLQEIRPGYAKWCAQGHKKSIWQRKTISFNSHSRISPNASIHLAHMLPLPFCKKYCIWLHESCIF